ncbi:hypothetical protein, partial [Streptomyces sp. NPDC058255]|uniref:hypothetical protein n=2 Tax=unclassified Streptomyces TaxID=2593676 RepID=UPI0036E605E2
PVVRYDGTAATVRPGRIDPRRQVPARHRGGPPPRGRCHQDREALRRVSWTVSPPDFGPREKV